MIPILSNHRQVVRGECDRDGMLTRAFTLVEILTVIVIIGILAGLTIAVTKTVTDRSKVSKAKSEMALMALALDAYKQQYGDYPWIDTSKDTHLTQFLGEPNGGALVTDKDAANRLVMALLGRIGPKGDFDHPIIRKKLRPASGTVEKYGKSFLDIDKFTFERSDSDGFPNPATGSTGIPQPNTDDPDFHNALLDPWGNRYIYAYRDMANPDDWKSPTFILMSAGPDGVIIAAANPAPNSLTPKDGLLDVQPQNFVEKVDSATGKGNRDNLYANR